MMAARPRGGSNCRAVMKASEIDSLDSYRACGPGALSASPAEQPVRVGLEPEQLTEPGRLRRFRPGRRRGHRRAPAARAQRVQAPARGDPVQPGPTEARPSNPARSARPAARCLAARPRRRPPSRETGSNTPEARAGTDRQAGRTRVRSPACARASKSAVTAHPSPSPPPRAPHPRASTDDGAARNWAPASRPVFPAGRRLDQQ